MPKYGNFKNRPVSWKLVPVEQKLAQFRPPEVERQLFQMITNGYSLRKLGRSSKMAHCRVKQIETLALVGVCSTHVGIFDLEHVKAIWGHSVHFSGNWLYLKNDSS